MCTQLPVKVAIYFLSICSVDKLGGGGGYRAPVFPGSPAPVFPSSPHAGMSCFLNTTIARISITATAAHSPKKWLRLNTPSRITEL